MVAKTAKKSAFRLQLEADLRACDTSATVQQKGKALESLVENIFRVIPGIDLVLRNRLNTFQTEEIDLAVYNSAVSGSLSAFPDIILVECKNWSSPIGSHEVAYFSTRLRHRGCTLGILLAMNGITGDSAGLTQARFETATALIDKIRIIVVTRPDLDALNSVPDFVNLLKLKCLTLVVSGTTI
ncbi:MAG: restriction endonuclease [Armatimonadetes bacterium]|nr:restriction endonuclease [Armatimonadota bacterium]